MARSRDHFPADSSESTGGRSTVTPRGAVDENCLHGRELLRTPASLLPYHRSEGCPGVPSPAPVRTTGIPRPGCPRSPGYVSALPTTEAPVHSRQCQRAIGSGEVFSPDGSVDGSAEGGVCRGEGRVVGEAEVIGWCDPDTRQGVWAGRSLVGIMEKDAVRHRRRTIPHEQSTASGGR